MKTNEAPEKIYVHIRQKPCEITFSEVVEKDVSNIEYTRTDAFIEKACEFLANDANIPLWEGYNDTFGCDTFRLVNNFKKYMEGE